MKPTSEILERINRSSNEHKDGVFTRLYRYLLREDIYYAAYQKLYANKGAMTPGANDDTADGFGKEYVHTLINELSSGAYQPKPVRREYIKKTNGKMRPLGIPSFRDKLLQEAVRMFLEAIYEPVFFNESHGFRPARSCHTALGQIKCSFRSTKWFIEGDIKGCFDNIDHSILISLLQKKIKDSKFVNVIRQFLKAGYVEDFEYNATISGTPQGGIISPILANIYLHELDAKVMEMKQRFDKAAPRERTVEYARLCKRRQTLQKKIAKATGEERVTLIAEYKGVCQQKLRTPSRNPEDKKLVYCRYADDFLIGVSGSRKDCESIKAELKEFLTNGYHLELSDEKTRIAHTSKRVRFLGYDIAVRRSQKVKKRADGVKMRTLNNSVELTVPLEDKIMKFLFSNGVIEQKKDGAIWPVCIPRMRYKSELEIVKRYDAQVRGICNFYCLAANYDKLKYFRYLMEYSCLKTLASKSNSTSAKLLKKYHTQNGWGIPYETKNGVRYAHIASIADCKAGKLLIDHDPWRYRSFEERSLTIRQRLEACACELCGKHSTHCTVHHAGSMKKLSNDTAWERKMRELRRKTLIVCEDCHALIHGTKS
jgi:group II intron reverse transcriptase/maturase